MGSKIGPGDTKILRILPSGTVQKPPNGGSAFCRSGIALFLMTGSRARSSVERTAHAGRVGPRVLEQGREPLGLVALARAGGHGLALAIPVARAPVDRLH